MANQREAFEEGLKDVAALPSIPAHLRYDAEDSAWSKLQPVIKTAKSNSSMLQGHEVEVMCMLLKFLVGWQVKRKVLKNRVLETLRILLEDDAWLHAAQLPSQDLHDQLLELFAGKELVQRRLQQQLPADDCDDDVEAMLPHLADDTKRRILAGARIMQEVGWVFPTPSPTSSTRDIAMQGFRAFYVGITHLSIAIESMHQIQAKEYAVDITEELAEHWPYVLQFLASMRVETRTSSLQIKFIVDTLCALVPSFQSAAECINFDFSELKISEDDCERQLLRQKVRVQWMWADAQLLSVPGMKELASVNPLRWSKLASPDEVAGELENFKGEKKKVKLLSAAKTTRFFQDPDAAVAWLREDGLFDEYAVA